MKNKKGFTLIEIIVVIVILAVLMAVAVPSVMSYINEADNAKYVAVARTAYINTTVGVAKEYALDGNVSNSDYNTVQVYVGQYGTSSDQSKRAIEEIGERKSYGSSVQFLFLTKLKLTTSGDDVSSATFAINMEGNKYKIVTVDANKKVKVDDGYVTTVHPESKLTS